MKESQGRRIWLWAGVAVLATVLTLAMAARAHAAIVPSFWAEIAVEDSTIDEKAESASDDTSEKKDKDGQEQADHPQEPDKPDNAHKPDKPDKPEKPDKADKPDNAHKPDKPDKPDKAHTPDNPDEPDNSDNPDQPRKPDEPQLPDQPDQPDTPDRPSTQATEPEEGPDPDPGSVSEGDPPTEPVLIGTPLFLILPAEVFDPPEFDEICPLPAGERISGFVVTPAPEGAAVTGISAVSQPTTRVEQAGSPRESAVVERELQHSVVLGTTLEAPSTPPAETPLAATGGPRDPLAAGPAPLPGSGPSASLADRLVTLGLVAIPVVLAAVVLWRMRFPKPETRLKLPTTPVRTPPRRHRPPQ